MVNGNVTVTVEGIAKVAFETNRAFRKMIGEDPGPDWDHVEPTLREATTKGVQDRIKNPSRTPEEQHETWMKYYVSMGWTYAPGNKDPEAKTHPNLVPYDQLPEEQRIKDELFVAVVTALAKLL